MGFLFCTQGREVKVQVGGKFSLRIFYSKNTMAELHLQPFKKTFIYKINKTMKAKQPQISSHFLP